ncbi:MAG: SART-1 family-domain-containing protein [Lentinula lateritia]|nr:MAG: SART-1 family-domain-containing protein [Lentinula lateritia]
MRKGPLEGGTEPKDYFSVGIAVVITGPITPNTTDLYHSTPEDDEKKQAEDNYTKRREYETTERETKIRNRAELNSSLKGSTLGDADDDTDNKEKELTKKRLQEFDSMDKAIQEDYTERDLAGLKVSHGFDTMDEGDACILTLKNSRILDNEEDELQNIEMAKDERQRKNQELKTKKHDYIGYDNDEFVEGNVGMKRAVVAKYDEEMEGATEIGFYLGSSVVSNKVANNPKIETTASLSKTLLSIDYNIELASEDEMDIDPLPVPRVRDLDVNFVDDDELQAALARSRRAKLAKPNKVTLEELARRVAEEQEEQQKKSSIKTEDGDGTRGLVFDDISEFVRATLPPARELLRPHSPSRDVSMDPRDEVLHEIEAGEALKDKDDDDEDDMEILNRIQAAIKAEESEQPNAADNAVGMLSEQNFKSSMASTLNIVRQQGILAAPSSDNKEHEYTQLQRDFWLADQQLERLKSRGGNKDQATREYENRLCEQQEARENLEMFKHYKSDVNIVYYDEHGQALTPKEAWKALSHNFHGKGSGRLKTEKRLKKIDEEKKQLAMASGDTPLTISAAFQQRQLKAGQTHFVFSVCNRGAVLQAADFDTQPFSKGKTENMKKKKKSKNAKAAMKSGLMTRPTRSLANGGTPAPTRSASVGSNGSPGPRAGFLRISSTVETTSQNGTGTPSERFKVAFELGTKHKDNEEATGSPPVKRR